MPLTIDRYTVLISHEDAEPSEHVVPMVNGDRLRAELEGPKHGVGPQSHPMHYMTLCLWAACLREQILVDVDFPAFKDRCLNFDEVEEPVSMPGDPEVVDPLGPTSEGIDSPSSSPESSAISPVGSTPTRIPVS